MAFAKWVFRIAGIYGVLVIAPLFFLEAQSGEGPMGPISRPEFYYGFAGVTLVFQFLFLLISADPARYRPIMLIAVMEKIAASAFIFLYLMGRGDPQLAIGGAVDQVLAVLFLASYLRTKPQQQT